MAKRYGLVIDLDRCIGCYACSLACKVELNMVLNFEVSLKKIQSPWNNLPADKFPCLSMQFVPMPCMHCSKPPCLEACHFGAINKRSDGIVLIDPQKCSGCQECIHSCPYNALIPDKMTGLVHKCTFCAHRLDSGLIPLCAVCCPTQAIIFGDLNDPASKISTFISQRSACVLKPELETNPAIFYCSGRH